MRLILRKAQTLLTSNLENPIDQLIHNIKKGYKILFHLIIDNQIKANPEKRVVYVTASQLI